MNILDKIVGRKRIEVAERKLLVNIDSLKSHSNYILPTRSLRSELMNSSGTGIIAEFKRKSPSKGWFTQVKSPLEIVNAYDESGAAAISVLTDTEFFGGSLMDLETAKSRVKCPILRKDFMIDTYQLHEARAAGADVILLIAAILSRDEVKQMAKQAKALSMEILLEVHNEEELEHLCDEVDFVGVNNRDLKTFLVDINQSIKLSKLIPTSFIKISESGIDSIDTIQLLKQHGFQGFLVGEKFMKAENPGTAFKDFINELNAIQ